MYPRNKQKGSSLLMAMIIASVIAIAIGAMAYQLLLQRNEIKASLDIVSKEVVKHQATNIKKQLINNNFNITIDSPLKLSQVYNGLKNSYTDLLGYKYTTILNSPQYLYNSNELYTANSYIDFTHSDDSVSNENNETIISNSKDSHYPFKLSDYKSHKGLNITPINVPFIDTNNFSKLRSLYELKDNKVIDDDIGFVGAFVKKENKLYFRSKDGNQSSFVELDQTLNNAELSIGWRLIEGRWQLFIAIYSDTSIFTTFVNLDKLINDINTAIIDLQVNLKEVDMFLYPEGSKITTSAYWYNSLNNNRNQIFLVTSYILQGKISKTINFVNYYLDNSEKWQKSSSITKNLRDVNFTDSLTIKSLTLNPKHNLLATNTLLFVANLNDEIVSAYNITYSHNKIYLDDYSVFKGWNTPNDQSIASTITNQNTYVYAYKKNRIGRFIVTDNNLYMDKDVFTNLGNNKYFFFIENNNLLATSLTKTKSSRNNSYQYKYQSFITNNDTFKEYTPITRQKMANNVKDIQSLYDADIGKIYLKPNALECALKIKGKKDCSDSHDMYINNTILPSYHMKEPAIVERINTIHKTNHKKNISINYLYIKRLQTVIKPDKDYLTCSIKGYDAAFFSTQKISPDLRRNNELDGYVTQQNIRVLAKYFINNKGYDGNLLSVISTNKNSTNIPNYTVICRTDTNGDNYIFKTMS